MAQLSLMTFTRDDELHAAFAEFAHLEVVGRVSELDELQEAVRRLHPDVLFADLGEDPGAVLDRIASLTAPRPLLLVAGPQNDSQLILRAMRLGAREYVERAPDSETLRAAVERLLQEHQGASPVQPTAPVLAVMGSKGGVGATFAACQLATELERLSGSVVLVDVNLRVGDVSLYFDLQPRYTLANLAAERDRFDSAYLHTILAPHASGVQVLAAPRRPEEADLVQTAHLERAISLLRNEFDWVVFDVSRCWDETSIRSLDLADEILLVTLMDVPTLNHARQHVDLLQRLGHKPEKVRLVANRYARSGPVSDRDFAEFLGRKPDVRIPNDYPTALACVNQGKSLSEIARGRSLHSAYANLALLAHDWCGCPRPTLPEAPQPIWKRVRDRLVARSQELPDAVD